MDEEKNISLENSREAASELRQAVITKASEDEAHLEEQNEDLSGKAKDLRDLLKVREEVNALKLIDANSTHAQETPIRTERKTNKTTNIQKIKAIPLAIFDFLVPLKSLEKPIPGYSQKIRMQARKWRMRGGLAVHALLIAGLATEYSGIPLILYETVNGIAMAATILNFGEAIHKLSEFKPKKIMRLFK